MDDNKFLKVPFIDSNNSHSDLDAPDADFNGLFLGFNVSLL